MLRPRSVAVAALTAATVLAGAACRPVDAVSSALGGARCGFTLTSTARVTNGEIDEASGLAASVRNPGVLWVHNDSGDGPRVFALSPRGATRATYALEGAQAVDWEDIAVGPGPRAGTSYLYVGDIGDNAAARDDVVVYRVAEPRITGTPGAATLSGVDALPLRYPDGPHDAESLFVDPRSGDVYVITKVLSGGPVGVYRAPRDQEPGETGTFTKVATVDPGRTLVNAVTAADASRDGRWIAVRTYGRVNLYRRTGGASPSEALARRPCRGPVPAEIQGEAVAFDLDGRGLTTVSEGRRPSLHHYTRS